MRRTVYGFTHVTGQGRLAITADLGRVLGWEPECRLMSRFVDRVAVFNSSATGSIVLQPLWRLWLPAPLVRRLRLTAGTGVLLAADPAEATLIIARRPHSTN